MYKTEAEALKDLKKMIASQHKAMAKADACQNALLSVAEDIGPRFSDDMNLLLRQTHSLRREMYGLMKQLQNLGAILDMSSGAKEAAEIYGPPSMFGL